MGLFTSQFTFILYVSQPVKQMTITDRVKINIFASQNCDNYFAKNKYERCPLAYLLYYMPTVSPACA